MCNVEIKTHVVRVKKIEIGVLVNFKKNRHHRHIRVVNMFTIHNYEKGAFHQLNVDNLSSNFHQQASSTPSGKCLSLLHIVEV